MKNFFVLVAVLFLACSAYAQNEDGTYGKDIKERTMNLPKCDSPIGKIVARGFKCKAAACRGDSLVFAGNYSIQLSPQALGEGLSDMLLTALAESGCFDVYERESMKEIEEELKMLGKESSQTLKGADFLITGAVTALEMHASGSGGGGGGLVIPLPFVGGLGLKASKSDAHIGIDLRVVRVNDAKILVSKAVEGKSGRWNFGVGGFGWFGGGGVGGWYESFKNTPLEEATRDVIAGAVTLIVENLARKNITGTMSAGESGKAVSSSPSGSQPVSGGLKRATVEFKPGDVVLWQENFSNCTEAPRGEVAVTEGSPECVELEGKKWLTGTKKRLNFEKDIPNWDIAKDWAIEYAFYSTVYGNSGVSLYLAKSGSPYNIEFDVAGNNASWARNNFSDVPRLAKSVQYVAVQKAGDTIRVFLNGKRVYTAPVDANALKNLDKKVLFRVGSSQSDISIDNYTLITDIKITAYQNSK